MSQRRGHDCFVLFIESDRIYSERTAADQNYQLNKYSTVDVFETDSQLLPWKRITNPIPCSS